MRLAPGTTITVEKVGVPSANELCSLRSLQASGVKRIAEKPNVPCQSYF